MSLKHRRAVGQASNVDAMASATTCPEPLAELPSDRHRRVYAALAGALPADQRELPAVRALAAAAAGHVLALDQLQRTLDNDGAVIDGKPSPLVNAMATVTAALVATLRAMRALPAMDRRTIASAAALERAVRGHRDLPAPPLPLQPSDNFDWLAIEEAERAARREPQ